jgi:hypothetical protein
LKYGGSTKRDSDAYTGGFGIGAKTPFAYTDNFFIITVCDVDGKRMKYYYQAAITGDGKREISQMISLGEEEVNEPTGTTIQVPIKQNDKGMFEREVLYATSFWSTKPTLKGFSHANAYPIEFIHKGKANFTVVKDTNRLYGQHTQFIALIDEIPYGLDLNRVAQTGIAQNESGFVTIFHFETSEITVSGSREDVEYIEENLNKFREANNKMKNEIKGHIEEYFKKSTSYYDRCVRANKIASGSDRYGHQFGFEENEGFIKLMSKLAGTVGIGKDVIYGTYEGERVVDGHQYRIHAIDVLTVQNDGKMRSSGSLTYSKYGDKKWELPIYLLDLTKAEPTRNAMLKQLHPQGYVLVKANTFDENDLRAKSQFEAEEKAFKLIGLDQKWKLYSEVEKLRNVGETKRNITDLVKVSMRWLRNPDSWNKSWEGIQPTYDKKNKEFVDIIDEAKKVFPACEEVVYFEVESLTDLNGTGYSCPQGMNNDQSVIRAILQMSNILTLAISKSKASYFRDAKIVSMEEKFVELMNAKKKEKSDLLSKSMDFQFASKHKANAIYFELDFGKEKNEKLKPLAELMEFARLNETILKRYMGVVGSISSEFAEKYKVGVSDDILKAVETLNEIQKDNQLVALFVECKFQGRLFNEKLLADAKEQLVKLMQKANK